MPSKEYLQAERNQPWREALRKTMKIKNVRICPRKMPEQPAEVRIHTPEVNLGLTRTSSCRIASLPRLCKSTCIMGCRE